MKFLMNLSVIISAIGAINWGFVAFASMDLVKKIAEFVPQVPMLDKIIYGIVAVAGIIAILSVFMKG